MANGEKIAQPPLLEIYTEESLKMQTNGKNNGPKWSKTTIMVLEKSCSFHKLRAQFKQLSTNGKWSNKCEFRR